MLFTDATNYFHSAESIDMGTISDHNQVRYTTEFTTEPEEETTKSVPTKGLGSFNFDRANKERMKECLRNQNLELQVMNIADPVEAKHAILTAFIAAAEEAQVPKKDPKNAHDISPGKTPSQETPNTETAKKAKNGTFISRRTGFKGET